MLDEAQLFLLLSLTALCAEMSQAANYYYHSLLFSALSSTLPVKADDCYTHTHITSHESSLCICELMTRAIESRNRIFWIRRSGQ